MSEPSRATIHAVLPLAIQSNKDDNDLIRAVVQGRTLRHFLQRDQLLNVNVVGRSSELQQIADALKPLETPWLRYKILDEAAVCPELPESPMGGWHKQQIIKLAAAEWLGAPFWLTLDADVLCTKPLGIDDLLPGGRALLFVDELAVVPIFTSWSWAVREVLGMVAPPATFAMSVTPLIYAAPIMSAVYRTIEIAHGRPWKDVLLDRKVMGGLSNRYKTGWAENQVYYAVAARSGLLRAYHALSGIDSPQRLHGHGIWRTGEWPDWDVTRAFDTKQPGFFAVCNSYTGVPPAFVAEKIEPFLAQEPGPRVTAPTSWLLDNEVENAPAGNEIRHRILSFQPLVILGPQDRFSSKLCNILDRKVLEPFKDQPAIVLVSLPWSREQVTDCQFLAARIARRQREAPKHRFVVLANTEVEVEMLRELGVAAVLVSHNALLDERPFLSDAEGEAEFDAVYNARFHPSKRHNLAAKIESLALIHADWQNDPEYMPYIEESRQALSHAVDLNRQADGSYRFIGRHELGAELQRARVGLCLSDIEGAMRASAEYMFAGLPVVATFSRGGREQFFDDDFCAVVPPSPELIAAAVHELAACKIPRQHIRQRVLYKVAAHRERLVELVIQAVAAIGHTGAPRIFWPWLGEERTVTVEALHRELRAVQF
jgi:glycosyltransferase involved in cell wall biosynthesis